MYSAIKEFLAIVKVLLDPEKRKESYKLRKVKCIDKCMEASEKTYFALDEFANGRINKKQMMKKYRYYRRIFFQNN